MRRALIAQLLVAAALPGSAAAAPRAIDFEQTVAPGRFAAPAPLGAQAASTWTVTAPRRAPARFDLLGVTASDDGALTEMRVRQRGRWTRWTHAHAGEPVWTGPARIYQLRTAGPARTVRLHFVAVRRSQALPLASPAARGRPAIVPRSSWDPGNDCPPRVTPIYGRVDFAMVHHTVSLNGYGAAATPAMILAICRFHRNGNEWNDIGYNLLVDRYGRIFEGRAGGLEAPVIGAQAQGWNSVSTGVAAIGDFSGGGASSTTLNALARAIAWKLGLAGVPASGPAIGEVSIGGDLNRWRKGAHVRFQRISGHRDGDETDCPGGALYAQLPALRSLVQRLLPPPRDLLTISPAVAPQPQGDPTFLTGRLARADGRRPAGAVVAVQQRVGGTWGDVASVATGADGIWSAALPLSQNGDVRAVALASGIASATIPVQVRAGVSIRVSARQVRLETAIQLTGATTPTKARVRVLVERELEGERTDGSGRPRFRRQAIRTIATVDGRYATALRLPAAGRYRVTVRTATDRVNAAGSSRALKLRVLRAR